MGENRHLPADKFESDVMPSSKAPTPVGQPFVGTAPSIDQVETQPSIEICPTSSNSDVLAELARIGQACATDARAEQELLLALWRRIERYEVSRRAMHAFAADLAWVLGDEGSEIAARIRGSFSAFPELELEISRRSLVDALVAFAQGGNRLAALCAATAIDPDDADVLDALLLLLAEYGHWPIVAQLLPTRLERECSNGFVAMILRRDIASRDAGLLDMLVAMLDRVGSHQNLAAQLLACRISETAKMPLPATTDPLSFASALSHARLQVQWRNAVPASSEERALRGRVRRLTELLQPPRRSAHVPVSASGRRRGPVRSWVDFQLDYDETILAPALFKTGYATRLADGALQATTHKLDADSFQYGPYVSLSKGVYRATFLGEVDPETVIGMTVSSEYGNRVLAKGIATPRTAGTVMLGELGFVIDQADASCEFVLTSHSKTGFLVSRGVKLTRNT